MKDDNSFSLNIFGLNQPLTIFLQMVNLQELKQNHLFLQGCLIVKAKVKGVLVQLATLQVPLKKNFFKKSKIFELKKFIQHKNHTHLVY